MVLKIFALLILVCLLGAALALAWFLVRLPGRIAHDRQHPQADAVGAAGWCSILLPIPLWPLAMIWAYYNPSPAHSKDSNQ